MRVANNTEWLFFHLWKKDPETALSCPGLYIAETILFRWAQPYFWYYTAKDGSLVRKTKEKVLLQHVAESFTTTVPKCGIISTCINSTEEASSKAQERIEIDYIEQSEFHNFLFQKEKPLNLILQKFIEPKNNKNALIKVSWTPQFCIFYRKTNINDLTNNRIPLVNRLTTFEGQEHLSTADSVSTPILASELEQTCVTIVKHINSVTSGNIQVSKMVLYFKLDERNRLWLLFCTNLKFREKGSLSTSKVAAKKKNQRPVSPILTMAPKKEEKNVKAKIDQELLLDDEMNQLNESECIKCSSVGLLYDLKMRIILEYEEKTLRENPEQEGIQDDFHLGSYRQNDHLAIINESRAVPSVMRKLYPNINEERYHNLKSNVSLMNMLVKLCENCYLEATESILQTKDDKKAKNTQIQIREKLKKNALKFGLQTFGKDAQSTVLENKSSQSQQKAKIDIEGLMSSHSPVSQFQGSQSHRMSNQRGLKSEISAAWPQSVKTSRFTASEIKKNTSDENEKVILPFIVSARDVKNEKPSTSTAPTKGYYFRAANSVAYPTDESQVKADNKTSFSPYAFELHIKSNELPQREILRPSKSVTALRKVNLNANMPTTLAPILAEPKITNKSGQKYSITTYSTMMSTIKDLKGYLSQNLENGEDRSKLE